MEEYNVRVPGLPPGQEFQKVKVRTNKATAAGSPAKKDKKPRKVENDENVAKNITNIASAAFDPNHFKK